MVGEKKEPAGDGVNEAIGNLDAATLGSDVIPDVIEV
jgi:hypothetical protein